MDERRITEAAIEAVTLWLHERHEVAATVSRRECRTVDGTGRADALVAARVLSGEIVVVAIESKSRFGRLALLPHLDEARLVAAADADSFSPVDEEDAAAWALSHAHAPGLQQVARYPADHGLLAIPEHVFEDLDLDSDVVDTLCARAGVGLLAVDYYGQWRWRVVPGRRPRPPLTSDLLQSYAAGEELRARLGP